VPWHGFKQLTSWPAGGGTLADAIVGSLLCLRGPPAGRRGGLVRLTMCACHSGTLPVRSLLAPKSRAGYPGN
jgi:hypothetical protein